MVKSCLSLLAGLALITSALGCCCLGYGYGYNRCNPCGSPCATGTCAPGSYYPPPSGGAFYQGYNGTAYMGDPQLNTAAQIVPGTYSSTALLPAQSLSTY